MLAFVTIIIPVASSDRTYLNLVSQLKSSEFKGEIILVGPDFDNIIDSNIHYIHSIQGRALQQNTGAIAAKNNFLWFLHADSDLSLLNFEEIQDQVKSKQEVIGFFNLKFKTANKFRMALNELGTHFRSHVLKMPFGDQGFLITKKTFFKLGLFDQRVKYGEDHLLIWRAHQNKIKITFLGNSIISSDRKYSKNGWLKTTVSHLFYTYLQALPEFIRLFQEHDPKIAIAIFVKTPPLSSVKTRLAKDIGATNAEEFYWKSVRETEKTCLEVLNRNYSKVDFYWAVAEKNGIENDHWSSFNTIYQNEGELGDRIDHVYSSLLSSHYGVILLGADCPILEAIVLEATVNKLFRQNKYIIGPSDDGGFYLFGGNKSVDKNIWCSTPYSCSETLGILTDKIGGQKFEYLKTLFDIDELNDLVRLSNYDTGKIPELIDWCKKILIKN